MDYNNNNIDEKEISLIDLLLYLVKRYRSILLVAVICALVVSAGAFVKTKYMTDEASFESYERELTTYKTDQVLLDLYKVKLEETKNYLVESPLINVESHNLPVATVSMCVEGTYAELLSNSTSYDPGDSILDNIALTIENGADWTTIAEKYGVDRKYVRELVSVSPDYNSNIVTISAYGTSEDMAGGILDDVRELVNDNLTSILDSYRGYYIKERNHRTFIDARWVNDIEETTQNSINTLITQINDLSNKYKGKSEPQAPDYFSVLRAIKYMLIGGVAGAVLMCGLYCVMYLLNDCIRDEDELHQYYGFFNLGTFSVKQDRKRANKFDDYLLKKQYGDLDDEYVCNRIAANINLLGKKDENVLLIGTVDDDKMNSLYDKLGSSIKDCKLVLGGNINKNNDALSKLADVESVIIVEERNVSKSKNIAREIDTVRSCNKKVLGYIQY